MFLFKYMDDYKCMYTCNVYFLFIISGVYFILGSYYSKGLFSKIKMVRLLHGKMTIEPRHDNTNKVTVRPAKTQISPVWSESSLGA